MATRSTIAIENADGTVSQIYSHWDGYLENNGKILIEHYTTPEKVKQLIAGGDISSLGTYISEKQESFDRKNNEDYTVYYTFRGEKVCINTFSSLQDYEDNHQYEEFEYIFTVDNVWSVFFNGEWHDLEFELKKVPAAA